MLVILAVCVVAGLTGAVTWGFLAPSARYVVTQEGQALLPGANLHLFDSLAIFIGITSIAGLVCGALVWSMRSRRGPLTVVMLVGASGLGSALAAIGGGLIAEWRVPDPTHDGAAMIVAIPAEMTVWQALIFQPLVAALVYFFAAGISPDADLGTGRPESGGRPEGGEFVGDSVAGVGEPVERGGSPAGSS
ncbi:DUF2567 domain-containing protein [Hoyosella sp. YIM 151337]|uniref:DUF2567 domain-containing protein n=1 Tax=Hoyosella sp. YIM 151337 TaxID=2992742 RepID=UPI0022360035|nr:DUF2567 domain-containing protein [Hoyosella sp. YIM 151337]MCW4355561.1 DUF2567 domain-containing protein [Hoyosella sp. YIM 151337]